LAEPGGGAGGLAGFPRLFTPLAAARLLRGLGLADLTECALRTRAYRKQVPFHRNGRRIVFTIGDLQEIAEGQPCRPVPRPPCPATPPRSAITARTTMSRRHPVPHTGHADNRAWRARSPRQHQGRDQQGTQR
jgi:hypothetical protein